MSELFEKSIFSNLKHDAKYIYYLTHDDEIVYIGQSINVFSRVGFHISRKEKVFNGIRFSEVDPCADLDVVEFYEIAKHQPKYNSSKIANGIGFSSLLGCKKYFDNPPNIGKIKKAVAMYYSSKIPEIHGVKFYHPDEVIDCVERYIAGKQK